MHFHIQQERGRLHIRPASVLAKPERWQRQPDKQPDDMDGPAHHFQCVSEQLQSPEKLEQWSAPRTRRSPAALRAYPELYNLAAYAGFGSSSRSEECRER